MKIFGRPVLNLSSSLTLLSICGFSLCGLVGLAIGLALPPKLIPSSSDSSRSNRQLSDLDFFKTWVVTGGEAKLLIQQGATLLDARGQKWWQRTHFPEAQPVTWQQFSQSTAPNRGKLLADDQVLTQMLQAIGISQHQPVVVFADAAAGWGEAGRIVWMLRTLGHSKAVMVDGGYRVLVKAGGLHAGASSTTAG
ncbi:MAG: sulfurtransferase, partial [Cyanothece sp. SIO1E1]|nr:sulfurtransferase [Cyanothece sp. SIO1E1]